MGEEVFRDGLREYLKAHAFGNATWPDLIDVLDKRTPQDLKAWSRVWVEEPGRPAIATELAVKDGRITRARLHAVRSVEPQARLAASSCASRSATEIAPSRSSCRSTARAPRRATAVGKPAPLYVLPNGGGWAYGAFVARSRRRSPICRRSLPDIADPLTRGAAWVTLWESMLESRVAAATTLVDLAIAGRCRARPTSS